MADYSLQELFRQEVLAQVANLKQYFEQQSVQEIHDALHRVHGLAHIVEATSAIVLIETLQSQLHQLQPGEKLDRFSQAADWLLEISQLNAAEQESWLIAHQEALSSIQNNSQTNQNSVALNDSSPPSPTLLPPKEASQPSCFPSPEERARERGSYPSNEDRSPQSASSLVDSQMMDLFRLEVEEQAKILNQGLLTLEANPNNTQPLEALMRAAHSIKGAARIVGLDVAVELAHTMEDCFVAAQNRNVTMNAGLIDQLLRGVDFLQDLSSTQDLSTWVEQHKAAIAALESMIQSTQQPNQIEVYQPNPPAIPDSPIPDRPTQRVVRVSADNLNRMMGLAGESLIEANALPAFADSLRQVRSRQIELSASLDQLGSDSELFETIRHQEQDCRNLLNNHLAELEDFIRRTTNLAERLYQEVINSHMRPFEEGVENFPRMVRDLARNLNKQVRLEILGKATSVDRDILGKLEAPMTHILRNAVDHGIESPETRMKAGKSAEGKIRIEAVHRGGMLAISITDDGAGIDTQRLRQAIVDRQLVTPDMLSRLSDSELMEFLFLPGFSLSEQVTELSGRGVGLDIVKSMAQEVGGIVRVASGQGKGTSFYFQLPLTLSVVRTLLVDVAGEVYAFPLSRIERILTLKPSEISTVENRQYFTLNQKNIGLVPLYQVLDLPPPRSISDEYWVVMLSDQSGTYGLIVDRALGEKELVVRPLDSRFGKVQDVSAAALMNDGSLVLILDVADLMQSLNRLLQTTRPAKVGELRSQHLSNTKRVLVVDDSITVRELERKLLQNHGYIVDVAVDGMEGWNALRSYPYDLVITDVDMPRMNGIELIKSIRQHSRFQLIPIIVVSYRDREDDRIQGLEAGADYYLTKSSFHDDTLIRAVTDLIGE